MLPPTCSEKSMPTISKCAVFSNTLPKQQPIYQYITLSLWPRWVELKFGWFLRIVLKSTLFISEVPEIKRIASLPGYWTAKKKYVTLVFSPVLAQILKDTFTWWIGKHLEFFSVHAEALCSRPYVFVKSPKAFVVTILISGPQICSLRLRSSRIEDGRKPQNLAIHSVVCAFLMLTRIVRNYGLRYFGSEIAIFRTCDLWFTHSRGPHGVTNNF